MVLQEPPLFLSEARNDKVHPGSQKGCPLPVPPRSLCQLCKGTGLSSDTSALVTLSRKLKECWQHPSTPVYSAGGTATALQQTSATTHSISPHSKHTGCSTLPGSAMMVCAPQLMDLGKGRYPKKTPAQGQGQGCAKHLSAASKACRSLQVSSPRKAARDACAAEGPGNHAGSPCARQAGRQRQAPPKGNPRGLFVSRHPGGVLPTLPSAMGSCFSHTPAREPVSCQEGSSDLREPSWRATGRQPAEGKSGQPAAGCSSPPSAQRAQPGLWPSFGSWVMSTAGEGRAGAH